MRPEHDALSETGPTIEFDGITKSFGRRVVVDHLTFSVRPGAITAFLGPNGAGKTTTIRMLLGLVEPDAGRAVLDGLPFVRCGRLRERVGSVLDSTGFPVGSRAGVHLRTVALSLHRTHAEVERAVEQVGLEEAMGQRIGKFSLGMRQRLLLAEALLADPLALILDEPTNGLDPAGVTWLRSLLRTLADEGRTVFLSSHLLAELELSVDDVVVINRGSLVFSGPLSSLLPQPNDNRVEITSDETGRLLGACRAHSLDVCAVDERRVTVAAIDVPSVARLAGEQGIPLTAIVGAERGASLERAYLDLISEHDQLVRVNER